MKITHSFPVVHRSNKFILLLIGLLIAGSLININTFGPSTLFAYFSYTIVGSLIAVIAGIGFIQNKQPIQIGNPLPILVFTLLAVYYILNGWVNGNGGINLRHYIILADAVLLISFCALFSKGQINLLAISKIITIIAAIESLICILQYFSVIPSLDTLFKVTGSNENPNVTAMFLAMAMPAILLVLFQPSINPIRVSNPYRILSATSIILCLLALGFLQCRTAFIGATVSMVLILNHQYQLLPKLQNKFSKQILIIIAAITLCLTAIAFLLLYHHKQASSDGRLFIWKISMQAIAQKPILGSGYGQFEHDYNLAQAKYFSTGTATQQEVYNASYVQMSYNEFLENLFEGGIIGLVLFVGLLVVLLFSPPAPLKGGSGSITAKEVSGYSNGTPFRVGVNNTPLGDGGLNGGVFFAYAGIITFTTMCFFNFTVQALPVRALFILYVAGCCALPNRYQSPVRYFSTFRVRVNNALLGVGGRVGVLALSIFLFFKLLPLSKAYNTCNTIIDASNDLGAIEASNQLSTLQNTMSQSTFYWHNYGKILFKAKKNGDAVEMLKKATKFSSDPSIYLEIANCYSRMGKFNEAVEAITIAKNIQPHQFAPLFALMKIHGFAKDTISEKCVAKEIITMNPKVASEKVNYYKQQARAVLNVKL